MRISRRFQVRPGSRVALSKWDPAKTGPVRDKRAAAAILRRNVEKLFDLQYLLYADNRFALLVVLQAMDAGGKDGTVRHVMTGLNPQGCRVTSFKAPSAEERAHDFLWRIHDAVPRRGEIGIFNRSHYEDVLVARVRKLVPKTVWSGRYAQINDFERMLHENGVRILKFFLHISRREQARRLRQRISDPARQWKLDPADFEERKLWGEYQQAYEEALSRCSTDHAPWYVIPSDRKWFRNLAVSQVIVEALQGMDLKLPAPAFDLSKVRLD